MTDTPRPPDPRAVYDMVARGTHTPLRARDAGYATLVDALMYAKKWAERQGLPWPPEKVTP